METESVDIGIDIQIQGTSIRSSKAGKQCMSQSISDRQPQYRAHHRQLLQSHISDALSTAPS